MEIKNRGIRNIFYDILRDSNSAKFSMTKFAALIGLILFIVTIVMGLILMWKTQTFNNSLFLELIGFVLTLLGFKNNFGIKTGKDSETNGSGTTNSGGNGNDDENPNVGVSPGENSVMKRVVIRKLKPDEVDDSLKG